MTSSYHLEDRGKNVPKLRFKGYNDELITVKLNKLFSKIKEKNSNGNITNVICNSAKLGLIPQREYFDKDIANIDNTLGYYVIKNNDFVYNPRKSKDAPYGPIGIYEYSEIGIVSPLYLVFRKTMDIDTIFFKYYFLSNAWHRYVYLEGDSGARHDRVSIKDNVFFDMPVKIPSLQEQEKIASFLTLIDKKIEKQKELVELLKKYKRGLLSAIFSQKLRFKDDNGNDYPAWEECRFDEIFQILRNNTLSRECLNYTDAGVKNIHYGDIIVKYNTCINDEIDKIPNINSDINLDKISDDNYLKVGDVIMADTAEDYTVGKVCEIVSCKAKILSGLHTIPCRPKRNFAKGYLGYYLNSAEYHDKLIPLITGIKVSAISKKEIKKTIIKYPIYMEQAKIANLLILIENKLNSNIKKLELLETYKKGLLQQLFI